MLKPPHIASAGGAAFWTGWLESMIASDHWTETMLNDLMYTLRIEIIEWILATRQSGPLYNAASNFMRDQG